MSRMSTARITHDEKDSSCDDGLVHSDGITVVHADRGGMLCTLTDPSMPPIVVLRDTLTETRWLCLSMENDYDVEYIGMMSNDSFNLHQCDDHGARFNDGVWCTHLHSGYVYANSVVIRKLVMRPRNGGPLTIALSANIDGNLRFRTNRDPHGVQHAIGGAFAHDVSKYHLFFTLSEEKSSTCITMFGARVRTLFHFA